MPLPVIRRAIEAFPPGVGFVNAYGQTETTSSLTVLGPEDHRLTGSVKEVEMKLMRLNSICLSAAGCRDQGARRGWERFCRPGG